MEFVQGRHFADPLLPGLAPQERRDLYDAMNEAIAAIHAVDPAAAGVADFGRPGNFFVRQIERWTRQYRASAAPPIAAMDRMVEALPALVPARQEVRVVHGDFRIDNLVFAADAPRVAAILDWELSTLGDPVSDLAYHAMLWHLPRTVYRFGIADADLQAPGLPQEAEYLQAYCRRVGRSGLPDWEFCMAFNLFRLTGLLHGIAGRVATGNASGTRAQQAVHSAARVAEIGWNHVERLL
jgi:aminoglycoside phosphotransferase (APT) family kinase protein